MKLVPSSFPARLKIRPEAFAQSNPNPITIQLLDKKNLQLTLQLFCMYVLNMEFLWEVFLSTNYLNVRQLLVNADKTILILIRNMIDFGFGLQCKNWIDNLNPKFDFDYGLLITIQSIKLDCNPDWAIQQFNPALPCNKRNDSKSDLDIGLFSFSFCRIVQFCAKAISCFCDSICSFAFVVSENTF